ncbi:survival motor neuron protein 1-like [Ylistrum balloti]|uniref:survival motor neuron protein 1-like n=1 Tax=Ylistrum balloti TaxID=509963 RepID=UPI002905E432|nr:survival motor neuron protein 1-like [Ylistrum balloti]
MATSGVGTVLFQKGQTGSGSDNELWDDTALIKAYDNAVKLMKSKIKTENGKEEVVEETFQQKKKKKNKKKRSKNKKRKWSPGDQCRAVFSEDGLIYDADILSVDEETSTCFVRYKGYGNEEEHNLSDLLLPTGRLRKQKLVSDVETDSMDWSDRPSPAPPRSNRRSHKAGQSSSTPSNAFSWPEASMFLPFQGMAPPQFPFSSMPTYPGFPPGGFHHPAGLPTVPPPPPPLGDNLIEGDNEALCSMLMSWYMSGYHTGYFQGLRHARQSGVSTTSHSESGR